MKKKKLKEKFDSKLFIHTWFIGIVFSLTYFHWLFFCIGSVLTLLQYFFFKPYFDKYGKCEDLENSISDLEKSKNTRVAQLENEYHIRSQQLENEYRIRSQQFRDDFFQKNTDFIEKEKELQESLNALNADLENAEQELSSLHSTLLIEHFNFSDYEGISSADCKTKLTLLKNDEQDLIKSGKAVQIQSNSTKRVINDNTKQILRCFNSECDNILMNLSVKNIDNMRNKVAKSFETLNKIFSVDGICLDKKFLKFKLEELNLVYTYEVKREQERELQKAIKEQMLEEEKVRREIESQKAKIEKDQLQCSKEINKLMSYMQKTQNDTEKQLYIDKIQELQDKLKELEASKETVLAREANARAGFV